LLHGEKAEGKLDEESVMILNHKEAIRYLVDNASHIKLSRNVICTIHYLLADGLVEPRYAGKVRDYPVRIGGSVYIPFEDQKRLQQQLEVVSDKSAMIRDPFEQSFFLLVHLSYLQAFADVNKRTARLVANIALTKENLVPLAFRDVEVKDYMSAMIAIYELQNIQPLVDLYVYSYLRTCAAYDSTVKAMGFDEVRVRYRQQRREILRQVILDRLVGDRMHLFIIHQAEKIITTSDQQAFIDDVLEDLAQIDESRLVGLGVTSEDLQVWQSQLP
jgi:Fic family protein